MNNYSVTIVFLDHESITIEGPDLIELEAKDIKSFMKFDVDKNAFLEGRIAENINLTFKGSEETYARLMEKDINMIDVYHNGMYVSSTNAPVITDCAAGNYLVKRKNGVISIKIKSKD